MNIKKVLPYLGYLLLIPALILNFIFYQKIPKSSSKNTYLVKEVLDGDTFVVSDSIIVRLFSVEAPELNFCGGPEAKKVLEDLILNKKVSLDVRLRDSYGRQLSAVYQGKDLINLKVLESGWFYYNGANFEQKELLKDAYHKAEENKIGIYSSLCSQSQNPTNPKCSIKGNIAKDTDEKIYHFPACGNYQTVLIELYRGEQWFCTEKEAQSAGFIKSKNCFDKKFIP